MAILDLCILYKFCLAKLVQKVHEGSELQLTHIERKLATQMRDSTQSWKGFYATYLHYIDHENKSDNLRCSVA